MTSTAGLLLRSTQALCQQLCRKETLEHGIAFWNTEYPHLPDVNQYREVVSGEPSRLDEAEVESERFFAERGLVCRRWAPAVDQEESRFGEFLPARGFSRLEYGAWRLGEWTTTGPDPEVRVLPGRAMRAALRGTFPLGATEADRQRSQAEADVCERRMDDPPYDMFVAVVSGRPTGRCACYQVGDIARIVDLAVASDARDVGVGDALLAHVLVMARRLAMRHVVAQFAADDVFRSRLFEAHGFVRDGSIVEFERAGVAAGIVP
jgi:ribosomal protein S18 acetylase RimI-like enzyme